MSDDESSQRSLTEIGTGRIKITSAEQNRNESLLLNSKTDRPDSRHFSIPTESAENISRSPVVSGLNPTIVTEHLNVNVLPDGRKLVNQYIMLETLGKGSFAKVKLAMDSDSGVKYAVKIMDKAQMKRKRVLGRSSVSDQLTSLRREIDLMKTIDHINIVKLHEIIDDSASNKIYLIMEHLVCGPIINLHDGSCTPLPESVCKSYLRDVLSGLEYLHSRRIAHRDIKPDNLLLSEDGVVKIADFGVSMQFDDSNDYIRATAGSLAFMAPEMCLSEGAAYSARKTDIWSAGISLYAMFFGKVPFTANSSSELYETISRANLECPRPIPPALETILRGLLEKDPAKRMTLAQLKEDPWLTDNGTHPFGTERNRQHPDHFNITIYNHESNADESPTPRTEDANSEHLLLTMRTNSVTSRRPLAPEPEESSSTVCSGVNLFRRFYRYITAMFGRLLSRIRRCSATVQQE